VTTSSQQQDYSTILNDTITISSTSSSGSGYINVGAGVTSYTVPVTGAGLTGSAGSFTISNGGSGYNIGGGTITIGGAGSPASWTTTSFNWKTPEEFVDSWPEYQRIQDMCEKYPGLKIAYEKFVTTYKMVKDDYDSEREDSK
jgi:hypothetical protein